MKILSIHDGHNASAALFDGAELLAAVSEERINREKFYGGWPKHSIEYVLSSAKVSLEDIDVVTVSHFSAIRYAARIFRPGNLTWRPKILLGHLLNVGRTASREWKVRRTLGVGKRKRFFFCDHHQAHAASAYFFSGFDDAIVLTIDGLGDSLSHTASFVENGEWKKVLAGGSEASLGAFYGALTEALGFKPNRHEGKIVGLAAMGNGEAIKDRFAFVRLSEDGLHFFRKPYHEMTGKIREWIAAGYSREDIAAYGQDMLEDMVVEHVKALSKKTPIRNLALAGGVFSNVKLNQKIMETGLFDQVFIQPAMGDEGLVLGSAAQYLSKQGLSIPRKLEHVYLGHEYSDEYVSGLLQKAGYTVTTPDSVPEFVAHLLAGEKIVGWFDGRMEFGPRALGHRTMMANPSRREVNDELNRRLRRSEFMPFAPSVLAEEAEEVFENLDSALHSAEFMTITFNVKEKWRERIRAVVHVDNTARPQLVRKDQNFAYHAVIKEFHKLTGIPLIVNTSFNMHEEPIVCSPEDALRAFDQGAVDVLVFNNTFLVTR